MKVIQVIDSFKTGGGVNSFVYDMCLLLKSLILDTKFERHIIAVNSTFF